MAKEPEHLLCHTVYCVHHVYGYPNRCSFFCYPASIISKHADLVLKCEARIMFNRDLKASKRRD